MKTIPLHDLWVVTNSAPRCGISVCDSVVFLAEADAKVKYQELRDAQEKGDMTNLYYEVKTLDDYISEERTDAREEGYNSARY
jgi:hypothetical protein